MSIESLELAIQSSKAELAKSKSWVMGAWAAITAFLFIIPTLQFFNEAYGTVYQSSYAPIVLTWFAISMGSSYFIAHALFASRAAELTLSVEIASSMLILLKEK